MAENQSWKNHGKKLTSCRCWHWCQTTKGNPSYSQQESKRVRIDTGAMPYGFERQASATKPANTKAGQTAVPSRYPQSSLPRTCTSDFPIRRRNSDANPVRCVYPSYVLCARAAFSSLRLSLDLIAADSIRSTLSITSPKGGAGHMIVRERGWWRRRVQDCRTETWNNSTVSYMPIQSYNGGPLTAVLALWLPASTATNVSSTTRGVTVHTIYRRPTVQ